jgi:hypothetical protein
MNPRFFRWNVTVFPLVLSAEYDNKFNMLTVLKRVDILKKGFSMRVMFTNWSIGS